MRKLLIAILIILLSSTMLSSQPITRPQKVSISNDGVANVGITNVGGQYGLKVDVIQTVGIAGTVTANQGTANSQANRWPVYWSDGVNERGTSTNPVSISKDTSGSNFYSVKRDNIAAVSVNLAFGFTSKKVMVEIPASNTDEVCIDWVGGVASCPAANTAGDDRLPPGVIVVLDDHAVASLSFISASGTQSVYVRAWN